MSSSCSGISHAAMLFSGLPLHYPGASQRCSDTTCSRSNQRLPAPVQYHHPAPSKNAIAALQNHSGTSTSPGYGRSLTSSTSMNNLDCLEWNLRGFQAIQHDRRYQENICLQHSHEFFGISPTKGKICTLY
jgi:hypothetical protein